MTGLKMEAKELQKCYRLNYKPDNGIYRKIDLLND